ncbi:MAG: NAD(P)H-dependent oxidoreductase [Roseburia sp.]|nr:NAD(P)H-dependent oxidoreductase [Roseburia sp.]
MRILVLNGSPRPKGNTKVEDVTFEDVESWLSEIGIVEKE